MDGVTEKRERCTGCGHIMIESGEPRIHVGMDEWAAFERAYGQRFDRATTNEDWKVAHEAAVEMFQAGAAYDAALGGEAEDEWRAVLGDVGDATGDVLPARKTRESAEADLEAIQAESSPPYDKGWIEHRTVTPWAALSEHPEPPNAIHAGPGSEDDNPGITAEHPATGEREALRRYEQSMDKKHADWNDLPESAKDEWRTGAPSPYRMVGSEEAEPHRVWDATLGAVRDLGEDEWELESHWAGRFEVHGEKPPGHQWIIVVPKSKLDAAEAEVERLREALRQILDLRDTGWATDPGDMDQRYVAGVYAGKLEKIWRIALASPPDEGGER
jgi:hypothetical protein